MNKVGGHILQGPLFTLEFRSCLMASWSAIDFTVSRVSLALVLILENRASMSCVGTQYYILHYIYIKKHKDIVID